ncbi:MAG: ribulose-phosphate 3-epimerase [Lachnospiraceae bacterium]|nr:ribulose-phosphate 3-epimerase [Lachnospiraceae bacterium]MBR5739546.1 ribulose-phosphate 3-epimerase [Lachnospiraceae bacterium]
MENKIAPSILSADWLNLGQDVLKLNEADCDYIHYDVMDGKFVPEMSFGVTILRQVKKIAKKPLDVHLMIEDPIRNVKSFALSGADIITVHVEACADIEETIDYIRSFGIPAALSVKPKTPVETVFPYLEKCAMILIMSVEPGFGGQAFMPEALDKISALRKEIDRRGLSIDIEVDGGINMDTVVQCKNAGANVFVSGSALFRGDLVENTKKMRSVL